MFEQTTLAELADQFDVFLIDQFGVLIDGVEAYNGASSALKCLNARAKRNLILSNSGKRSLPNEARLTKLGFDRDDYVMVLTSGEVAYNALSQKLGGTFTKGSKVFTISRDGDRSCVEGLDVATTPDISDASLIIIAGSEADQFSLAHYENLLRSAAASKVPCWCTNPDNVMLAPQGITFGAGQIANLYQQLGGTVEWFGKPHISIYQIALERLGSPASNPTKVLCIGDSIEHDIGGGTNAGFKTALVRTGVHKHASLEDLASLSNSCGAAPDFVIPAFSF